MAATRPRIRRHLDKLSALRDTCGEAMIICGLPTPWYLSGPCCDDPLHLDNITDRELGEVHADPAQKPLPGWIIGGNQGGARGSDQGRGLTGGLGGDRVKVDRGKGKG